MKILQSNIFKRRIKKLHENEKQALDDSVKEIAKDSTIGTVKVGDLKGVLVYKYKLSTNQYLLAYTYNFEEEKITLLAHGSHENFYRDLKKQS